MDSRRKLTETISSVRSFPLPNNVGIGAFGDGLVVGTPPPESVGFELRNEVTSICKFTVFKCCFNLPVGISWLETALSSPRNEDPTWLTNEERVVRSLIKCSKCFDAFWR